MRQLKGSSNYLKNQVLKTFSKEAPSILIFSKILFALTLRVLSMWQVGPLEEAGLVLSIAPFIGFYFAFANTAFSGAVGKVKNK